jgi:LCP family protein required for cell wall assembly
MGVAFLVLVVLGAGLLGYAAIRLKQRQLAIPLLGRSQDEPMNVLVLGSDSREGLSKEDQAKLDPTGKDAKSGRRADTIVLVHIDEKKRQAVVVHFPRDLKVTFPDGRTGKINGAYQKGPAAMVKTVEKFSGLPIHHYIEVNFVGFRNIVQALGGVKVYFERSIHDKDSGLNVPKGCVELTGDRALAFVRVRKIDSDFGRIARQQLFARLVMDKVVSAGTLLNPIKLVRLVSIGTNNIRTDDALGPGDMKDIALRLRSFDPGRVDMRVVPSTPGSSFVYENAQEADALFDALKDRTALPEYGKAAAPNVDTAAKTAVPALPVPPAVKPGDVSLSVLNGTERTGLARAEADRLTPKGFEVVEVADADSADYVQTVVFYHRGKEPQAQLVADLYGAQTKPVPSTIRAQGDVVLVVGPKSGTATTPASSPAAATSPTAGTAAATSTPKALIHAC